MTNETTNNHNEPIATLVSGTVLNNKYELVKQVSNDAMGAVWKAKDRVADRTVALKFVPNELRQNESEMNQIREMFKRVHALQHPAICALYGLEDGGHLGYYFVIRYLKGETLAQYAERNDPHRNGLPPSNVIRILSWGAGVFDVSSISVNEHELSGVAAKAAAADVAFRPAVERSYIHTSSDTFRIWIIVGCVSAIFLLGIIAWGVMGDRDKTPAEVVVQVAPQPVVVEQVAPQPVIVEQVTPPAPPQKDIFGSAREGATEDVKYHLDRGINVNAKDDNGFAPLHTAAILGHVDVVKLLVSRGADVNLKNNKGTIPLHAAANYGHIDVVKVLISAGANISAKSNAGNTPLHSAAIHRDENQDTNAAVEILRYLVSQGADVNAKNNSGNTPLDEARNRGYTAMLRYLESVTTSLPQPAYQSPFKDIFEAAAKGTVRDVEYFIKNGADVNARVRERQTEVAVESWFPLLIAARQLALNVNVEVVKYLVSQGADVNMKNNEGTTALHEVAYYSGNVEIIKILISQGADVNAKTFRRGDQFSEITPLHSVAMNEHPNAASRVIAAAQVLVEAGADVSSSVVSGFGG